MLVKSVDFPYFYSVYWYLFLCGGVTNMTPPRFRVHPLPNCGCNEMHIIRIHKYKREMQLMMLIAKLIDNYRYSEYHVLCFSFRQK